MKHRPSPRPARLALLTCLVVIGTGKELPDAWAEAGARTDLSAKEQLGRKLFYDTRLSDPAGQACATCHAMDAALADPERSTPTSRGVNPDRFGNRNTPTAAYAAFSPAFDYDTKKGGFVGGQFWDGRAATLEEQAKGPFLNPAEMANTSKKQVVDKVRTSEYAPLFRSVFGEDAFDDAKTAYDKIAQAIAAFERTASFRPFTSKYDAWLAGKAELTAQEHRGRELFERPDKGNCAVCHPSRPDAHGRPPLFTDFSYDNLGVPRNPDNRFYTMPRQFNPEGRKFVDKGLGAALDNSDEDGKFKTPTLRNIALTAPYMHNGYFGSLRGVVDFYNSRDARPRCAAELLDEEEAIRRGCWPRPELTRNVNGDEVGRLGLSPQEVDDIVAFLNTLTDGWHAAATNVIRLIIPGPLVATRRQPQ